MLHSNGCRVDAFVVAVVLVHDFLWSCVETDGWMVHLKRYLQKGGRGLGLPGLRVQREDGSTK